MRHRKSVIEVKIRIDPIEGWGYQPEDHIKLLEDLLAHSIPHYKPEVRLLRVENELRCPDCGSTLFVHNPLDSSDHVCKECGLFFNPKRETV